MVYLMKKGFTLIELLVVISIIGLLMSILLPSLARARLQAKILAVNADLRQIGLALECYYMDHEKYPPTRQDCMSGMLKDHLYQLPGELAEGGYLPITSEFEAMSTTIEDRFNARHTYKYRSIGECITDRDIIDKWIKAQLWIPDSFPEKSSIKQSDGRWYDNINQSPAKLVLFSVGPNFDEKWVQSQLGSRYPIPREVWYNPQQRKGFLVRIHWKNGDDIGSFRGN
jgi:prepilin-type N-terminal cleavage/methylation domain-containing protein